MTLPAAYWETPHPVLLAPMSGITDTAFRKQARRFGATMVVTEMVASERYVAGHDYEALRSAEDTPGAPWVMQLAGRQPDWLREAALKAEANGASAIDINMGCPAKRVVGGYGGSALMRDLALAETLIAAVTRAVSVPVTVKMRLGWNDETLNAPDLARIAEAHGVKAVTVHGRTRCQFYKGRADWRRVAAVVAAVTIPVLVNGDIDDTGSAREAVAQSDAAGVMIGRAAVGRPWLLGRIAAGLAGKPYAPPSPAQRRAAILDHFGDSLAAYGPRLGLINFRKHLAAYLQHEGGDRAAIAHACTREDPAEIVDAVCQAFAQPREIRAAA